MGMKAEITDLWGTRLCLVTEYSGLDAILPLSDSRTGTVIISMDVPAAAHVAVGTRICKVWVDGTLVLQGIMLTPSYDFGARLVTVPLHDHTIRLKKRNMCLGMASVTASIAGRLGIPIDGNGMRTVLHDAQAPFDGTITSGPGGGPGIPPIGIADGIDTVTPQPTGSGDVAVHQPVSPGDVAYDIWQDLATTAGDTTTGLDFTCQPTDAENPGAQPYVPGYTCELITRPSAVIGGTTNAGLGIDRTQHNAAGNKPLILVLGEELATVVNAPDLNSVINYEIQDGGDGSVQDSAAIAAAWNYDSMLAYGMYQDWESGTNSTGEEMPIVTLIQRAKAYVSAYAWAPNFVTATLFSPGDNSPDWADPVLLSYPGDYGLGDQVTVVAKAGYVTLVMDARITAIEFTQADSAQAYTVTLTLVPNVQASSETLSGLAWNEADITS